MIKNTLNQNILVIKHGSLGDWIQATGAFKLIRTKHPKAKITVLTHPNYSSLARNCSWFNEICLDRRLPAYKIFSNFKIIKQLRNHNYTHVYDLQCSKRTNLYHHLIKDKVKNWYGRAKGCSHYVPFNNSAHSVELSYDIIKASGINDFPTPDINWLKTDKLDKKIKHLNNFALFIPGSSAKHSAKRWVAERYAKVIDWLHNKKIRSVLIGTEIDKQIINEIILYCTATPINLINQAGFAETAELARASRIIIGSDTGPTHIANATKTPTLTLFTGASNPKKSSPWGTNILSGNSPELLSTNTVLTKISEILKL